MNCCEKCFKPLIIKSLIKSLNCKGKCDFCEKENVFVYNIKEYEELAIRFNNIFNVFRKREDLPKDYPADKIFMIKEAFNTQFNVFSESFPEEKVVFFLEELMKVKSPSKVDLLKESVGVSEYVSSDFLASSSLLKEHSWESFKSYIKHTNRFHSRHINFEIFKEYIEGLSKTINKDSNIYYRARISNNNVLTKKDMGSPPANLAKAGRGNSEGVSHLYLATDIETVIKEIRPKTNDSVYIGKFALKKDIKVVDFQRLNTISIFDFEDNPAKYIINHNNFQKLNEEISKPMKSGDSTLDYLTTQFFVDYIKCINDFDMRENDTKFMGIEFKSTLSTTGHNLMAFSSDVFECESLEKTEIKYVTYNHELKNIEE